MVTFIIGNGFDIQVGLNTRYTDFYKEYVKVTDGDSLVVQRFKSEIAGDLKTWADFELQMGKYSEKFLGETTEEFLECHNDFVNSLNDYLKKECGSVDWRRPFIEIEFLKSIVNYQKFIKSESTDKLKSHRKHFSFLQFNYTDAFNILLNRSALTNASKLDREDARLRYHHNIQVHGRIDDHPVVGVGTETQIANKYIRANSDVKTVFVKPNYLEVLHSQDVNQGSVVKRALDVIDDSKVICSFGASIGDTDGFWWRKVGDWLKKSTDTTLVIFNISGVVGDGVSPLQFMKSINAKIDKRNAIKKQFAKVANLEQAWLKENESRVIVELDSDMFNFKLPRKEPAPIFVAKGN